MRIPFSYEGAGFHLTREEDFIYQAIAGFHFIKDEQYFFSGRIRKITFFLHEKELRISLDE
jgi:hypothetical protein